MEKLWYKNWPSEVPRHLDYPIISLPDVLKQTARTDPERTAIVYYGRRLTYSQLDDLTDTFVAVLQKIGIKKGDRVAVYLPNIPQFILAYYGALRAGATVVTSSPLYKERELGHILNDSGAEVLVAYDRLYPIVQAIREKTKLRAVITTSVRDFLPSILKLLSPLKGVKSYRHPGAEDMMELLRDVKVSPTAVEIDPREDIALLQYTGGTTGTPKGAMITHYNLVVNAVQVSSWLPVKGGEDVFLSVLPFFHIYGMTALMNVPIYNAVTMVILPDPRDPGAILKAITKFKPTIFCSVPTMYIALLNRPDISKYDLRSIRACISGASALPPEIQKKFEKLTGGRLVEGYGLTESSPVAVVNPMDDPKKNRPGSIGIPIPDTEVKILDLETGRKELPVGDIGELAIHGPQVMVGYWNRPEETSLAIRDGWLYTGDIAKLDEDGYVYIVDRKKDMINVSGFKVWPREVEDVLYEHPAVREAAVIGVSDAYRGETVKAYVVLKDGYEQKATEEELIQFCKSKIASFKAPTKIEFRSDLPKTPVGKILRRALKEESAKPLA